MRLVYLNKYTENQYAYTYMKCTEIVGVNGTILIKFQILYFTVGSRSDRPLARCRSCCTVYRHIVASGSPHDAASNCIIVASHDTTKARQNSCNNNNIEHLLWRQDHIWLQAIDQTPQLRPGFWFNMPDYLHLCPDGLDINKCIQHTYI